MRIIEIIATICTVVGYLFVSQQIMWLGLGISAIANVLWFTWAIPQKAYGIVFVNSFLLLASVLGFVTLFQNL